MTNDRDQLTGEPTIEREGLSTADLAGRNDQRSERDSRPDPQQIDQRDVGGDRDSAEPLFPSQETQELRDRWQSIQAAFVDEPRKAVEDADGLVASAMKRLAEIFASERDRLESQWDRGDDVSTEDLRVALRRYRSFFDRLLSM